MTLRVRTSLVLALALTVLPALILLTVVFFFWSDAEHSAAEDRTVADVRSLSTSLEQMIEESRRVLEVAATRPTFRQGNPRQIVDGLSAYTNRFPYSRGVFFFDSDGWQMTVDGPAKTGARINDRQWFIKASQSDKFVVGEFIISRLSGIPALPMALSVSDQGRLVGVLGMSIDLAKFYERIEAQERLKGAVINFVSATGDLLLRYPDPEAYIGKSYSDHVLIQESLKGRLETKIMEGLDGESRLYSFEPLEVGGERLGTLSVGIPADQVHIGSEGLIFPVWLLSFILLVAIGFVPVYATRVNVLRPLEALSNHSRHLAEGQFSARVETSSLPYEMAQLGDVVNAMASALERRDAELSQYRDHLEVLVSERTAELEASRADLERSNAELQQFAYVASHDLQEPLRMVASFSQLIERKYGSLLDDQGRQYIHFAVDGATRMQNLINDLLAYSRVETQAKDLVPVAASEVVTLALQNLSVLVAERKAVVEVGELPTVIGDRGQLVQVVQNLVANGLKFNRSVPPRVTIRAQDQGAFVQICVEDNGIGIDPQFGERIFVIFQRLNPRSEFGGTGIGLAVCRRVVEKHGGKIWYEPAPSGGSQFFFTLKTAPRR